VRSSARAGLGSARQAGTNVQETRADVAYTNAGQRQSLTRYSDVGGTARTSYGEYGYDPAGRLTALVHWNDGGVVLVSYGWIHDGQGRPASPTPKAPWLMEVPYGTFVC
jgi:YD repeat-containing protein